MPLEVGEAVFDHECPQRIPRGSPETAQIVVHDVDTRHTSPGEPFDQGIGGQRFQSVDARLADHESVHQVSFTRPALISRHVTTAARASIPAAPGGTRRKSYDDLSWAGGCRASCG